MRRFAALGAAALFLASASTAGAATITFDNVEGTWSDTVGGVSVNYTGNGTQFASVSWGTGTAQSGYDFDGVAPPPFDIILPPSPTADFLIGEFTHRNQPISAGTSITGTRLTVTADVWVDPDDGGVLPSVYQGNKSFVFDFIHNETPNGAAPCADGGTVGVGVNVNGCADSVTFLYNFALSDSFDVDGVLYTLTLKGFLQGGSLVSEFWTVEAADNHADLMAYVTTLESLQGVPEPASMLLVGAGLAGLAARRRRRQ